MDFIEKSNGFATNCKGNLTPSQLNIISHVLTQSFITRLEARHSI